MDPDVLVEKYWAYFMAFTMIVLVTLGIIILIYAFKSRNKPEKATSSKYFINEILVAIFLFIDAIVYPFLFDEVTSNHAQAEQIYTFIGLAFAINLIVWVILIPIWKIENFFFWKYLVKKPQRTYESWKKKVTDNWRDTGLRDIIRKLIHFAYIALVLVFWYMFKDNPIGNDWTSGGSAVYYQANILFNFAIVMLIFDLIRLNNWKIFGAFPRLWAEGCIKPSELETFASSGPLLVAMLPFIIFGHNIFFCVALIAPVSDAMASIIGKNFGKKRPGKDKTIAGFIGGCGSAYLIVVLVNELTPFPGLSMIEVNLLALGAAFGFLLVDMNIKKISDNFANPVVVGLILASLNFLFTII